jgi:transcription elongation factor Elf1
MNAPPTRFTCGRCGARTSALLTRWHQLFVCPKCLDELDTPLSPVTRTIALDRALCDRLLPIASQRGMPVAVLATRVLDIISRETVLIDNLLDEEA